MSGTTTADDLNLASATGAGIGASDTISLVAVDGRVGHPLGRPRRRHRRHRGRRRPRPKRGQYRG
ncbi:hypothetical protein ABZ883_12615 [Streptomyces sp. NPDC046977]|uniref:hypothetical protein n=1 Tax=Streptomyces sp. NPDC046977 TaxID=3154703 RepID=UPI0033D1C17A